jgi:hypothetical protein
MLKGKLHDVILDTLKKTKEGANMQPEYHTEKCSRVYKENKH